MNITKAKDIRNNILFIINPSVLIDFELLSMYNNSILNSLPDIYMTI